MAKETEPDKTELDDQTQDVADGEEPDYKALYEKAPKSSRRWETRSKANLKELNELKSAAPKADPTVEERLGALESENAALKASAARSALVDSVAKATGLDRTTVAMLNGSDEDALTEQANALAAAMLQSTRPRGARPTWRQARRRPQSFNPRAREGRDSSSMHSHRIEPVTLYRKSLSADFSTLITPIRRTNPARTSLGNLQSLRFARDFRTETVYTSRRNYLCARR